MISSDNTFHKKERLYLNKDIETLFSQGKSFIAYPLRVVYLLKDEEIISQQQTSILVSVSKKKFKRAVKRNRVKRLLREAFRLNKSMFNDITVKKGKSLHIAFIYLKNELPDYPEIEKAIMKTQAVLSEKIIGVKDEESID